jgi:hypothetical protein
VDVGRQYKAGSIEQACNARYKEGSIMQVVQSRQYKAYSTRYVFQGETMYMADSTMQVVCVRHLVPGRRKAVPGRQYPVEM